MKRNQFTFYRSFFEALSLLPKRVRLDTYEAIIAYALDGTEPELAESAKPIFLMARPVLDSSRRRAKYAGNSAKLPEFCEDEKNDLNENEDDFTETEDISEHRERLNESACSTKCNRYVSMEKEKETEKEPENKPEAESKPEGQAKSREDFARFWLAYPKRVNREEAFRAYMAADASPQELLAAVQRQRAGPQWREQGGRFVPQPANWLRRRGWLDEPAGVGPPPRQDATLEDLQRMQEYLKEFNSS